MKTDLREAKSTALDRNTLPPMMQRYLKYKDEYPDILLFFQVGDFYELFFDDAVTVSKALNLTLTARDKAADSPIPMCGVPVSVIDSYMDRLVSIGLSSAIVSQVSSTVNGKVVIDRELNRIVTPGNRLFSNLDSDSAATLVCAAGFDTDGRHVALAWMDSRQGIVSVKENIDRNDLSREVGMIAPREVILPRHVGGEALDRRLGWVRSIEHSAQGAPVRFRPDVHEASSRHHGEIPGYTTLGPSGKRATRTLISYIDETTVGCQFQVRAVVSHASRAEMIIDAATRRNLELVTNARDGSDRGTLFDYMNLTVTPAGGRALRAMLVAPNIERETIEARLDSVGAFKESGLERQKIRDLLVSFPDIERLTARVELRIATPRDVGSLRDALVRLPQIKDCLGNVEAAFGAVSAIPALVAGLSMDPALAEYLDRALLESPPHSMLEGGIIRQEFDPELDRVRGLRTDGDRWMAEFEAAEKRRTGINSLKVRRNNVIGYFLEVPTGQASKIPAEYIRRQSTANAERYTTTELRLREQEVVGAIDKQVALERSLFEQIRAKVDESSKSLRTIAASITELDVYLSLALLAEREDLTRPLIEESRDLDIRDGRHPMIARRLDGGFVPNSLVLSGEGIRCCLITGPNMGGKSTYLRQAALIIVMAQIGSYVPATYAKIGITDKIFARIGASDDIHDGDSTFMVEMREASYIIGNATERSLVLIDEIGRGTATSDGLALARAILEWLLETSRCRTLFATHFHELTSLADGKSTLKNLSVGSEESEDGVVFTHCIHEGPAPRSYGIEVAKLSGLPRALIERAEELIESTEIPTANRQLSIFAPRNAAKASSSSKTEAALVKLLREANPDDLSPREAMNLLYRLRDQLDDKKLQDGITQNG